MLQYIKSVPNTKYKLYIIKHISSSKFLSYNSGWQCIWHVKGNSDGNDDECRYCCLPIHCSGATYWLLVLLCNLKMTKPSHLVLLIFLPTDIFYIECGFQISAAQIFQINSIQERLFVPFGCQSHFHIVYHVCPCHVANNPPVSLFIIPAAPVKLRHYNCKFQPDAIDSDAPCINIH